jgi:toxin-antitoxin system PIN domain toxin
MIVIDANLLLYAYNRSAPAHADAKAWFEQTLSHSEPVGIPWQSISAFIRIATNSNLPDSLQMQNAVAVVHQWLTRPQVQALAPGDLHWTIYRQMLIEGQVRGPLTSDAQLAALTIEFGGTLHTTDRDFTRFPGLRWVNPLHT